MFQKKIRVFHFFFHNYFHHFEVVQKRYVYILGVCMIFFIMVDEGGIFFRESKADFSSFCISLGVEGIF